MRTTSESGGTSAGSAGDHLGSTALLDLDDPSIRGLVAARAWGQRDRVERVGAIYDFVRNEIPFGYSARDDLPASRVLTDGYGQCNTKATLLMALLRAAGVPCRLHGATIHRRLQRGLVPAPVYPLAPTELVHSWVEVLVGGDWKRLEGVILDDGYLDGLRRRHPTVTGEFLGFGVGTADLQRPPVAWDGEHTAIQMDGVVRDLGVHDDPDALYRSAGANLSGLKAWLYAHVIRHAMNRTVTAIRASADSR